MSSNVYGDPSAKCSPHRVNSNVPSPAEFRQSLVEPNARNSRTWVSFYHGKKKTVSGKFSGKRYTDE